MSEEKQIATLVGLDLILSPEHYKEITKLQQENKQLKENKKELIEFLKEYDKYRDSFKWNEQDYIDTIEKIKEILGDKEWIKVFMKDVKK